MSKDKVADAYDEMAQEYEQFRRQYGKILEAVQRVGDAEVGDDVYSLLERLEDVTKEVRTGGLMGSGAKGYREAREKYIEVSGGAA